MDLLIRRFFTSSIVFSTYVKLYPCMHMSARSSSILRKRMISLLFLSTRALRPLLTGAFITDFSKLVILSKIISSAGCLVVSTSGT